jgi:hypothetical protein
MSKLVEHPITHNGELIGTAVFPKGVKVKPEEYKAVKDFLLSFKKAREKYGRRKSVRRSRKISRMAKKKRRTNV